MRLLKRTYALPPDTIGRFEQKVQRGKRSSVVSKLLQEWLDEQQRQQLRAAVIEGCHDMAEIDLEIEREFHPLEEEVERVLGSD
jgi:Arc/MetJ-type ribon-helix-helix transcriptional regulator